MATRVGATLSERLLVLIVSVVAIFVSWSVIRYWLVSVSFPDRFIHFIDVGVVVVTGIAATITLVRLIARPVAARAGPTQINTLKLLFQLLGLGIIIVALVLLSGPTGSSFLSALVGIGFFGIVVGLAAQAVLGNLFSGLMLLAARPFNINDRIALITWQYGKFAPSLAHGWMEPSYTGVVKGISLTYTRILTDSNALLKVPNSIVTQSLIMNLSHGRQGLIAIQFEAPIQVDPRDLRKNLNSTLSKMNEFKGEEDNFEILEASPTGYLVAMSYRVEKQTERQMKSILLNGVRNVLNDAREQSAKGAK
jgi:small-conductance mechanosensitive channel